MLQAAAALDHSDVGGLTAGVAGLTFEEGLRYEEEQRAAQEPQTLPPWACACVDPRPYPLGNLPISTLFQALILACARDRSMSLIITRKI